MMRKTSINGKCDREYRDEQGNVITFGSDCKIKECEIEIDGIGNNISFGSSLNAGIIHMYIHGDDHCISFGDNITVNGFLVIKAKQRDAVMNIGNRVVFQDTSLDSWGYNKIEIGDESSFGSRSFILAHSRSEIILGKDTMCACDAIIQTGDGHTIFSVETGKPINYDVDVVGSGECYSRIIICNHVWIGRRAFLLSGSGETKIESGSIIGAESFVKGFFQKM